MSASILATWQRCPRKARLELPAPYGMALEPRERDGEPSALEVGRDVHLALETYHRYGIEAPLALGPRLIPLAAAVVGHWLSRWHPRPWPGHEVVEVERSWRVPLGRHELVGTWDLVLAGPAGRVWVVDHKTFGGGATPIKTWPAPSQDACDRLPQLRLYAWAAELLLARPTAGYVWAGLRKSLPAAPKRLASGNLSADVRSSRVTLASYQAAGGDDPKALAVLQARKLYGEEDEYWWPRRWCAANEVGTDSAAFTAARLADELEAAPLSPACNAPRYDWRGCPDCAVRPLCDAIERGQDWRADAETYYTPTAQGSRSLRQTQESRL